LLPEAKRNVDDESLIASYILRMCCKGQRIQPRSKRRLFWGRKDAFREFAGLRRTRPQPADPKMDGGTLILRDQSIRRLLDAIVDERMPPSGGL